jgi:predicted Zn-ribbon and HTH transcriptional regulator
MSHCQGCGIEIPTRELSGLGTCPKCVREWIKDYKSYHDRRYGKRRKADV